MKNKILKNLMAVFCSFVFAFSAAALMFGCDSNKNSTAQLVDCEIQHEEEFGGVYIKSTIEDFNELGFEYGDSVNIVFSNGYHLDGIPYYNGYYTKTGEPLLIAYPGYDYIKAAINNGDDLWERADLNLAPLLGDTLNQGRDYLWQNANLDGNMTATITLDEKGKYLDIQEARDIHYFDDRTLYPSDQVFANFRALKGGSLKENVLYRSASPCDNQHSRAQYVDKLIEQAGVQYIINLADTDVKIQSYMAKDDFNSSYFANLYDADNTNADNVASLALNMNFGSDYFKGQVVKALKEIATHNGPYLIHCTEGKDRTGFVCMLIEAFAGASYEEIVEDYMMTYFNYYAITKAFDEGRYNIIVENLLVPMIEELIVGDEAVDVKTANLKDLADSYLLANGMTQDELNALCEKICNVS